MTRRIYSVAYVLAFAAVYFGAAKFGLSLAVVNASSSAVWPATGIALAVLLLWGYRLWPGIFLGAFLANLTTQGTFLTSLGIASGNTLEALVGVWLVNQYANGRQVFEQARDFFKFILLAAIVSTTFSATFGATSLALGGFAGWSDYVSVWMTWWLGDAVGSLLVTPLILTWSKAPFLRWNRRRLLESIAIIAGALLVGMIAFNGHVNEPLSRYIRFLLYPTALWAAYRFGQFGAINAVFTVACVAIWGTLRGSGPFALAGANESLMLLQAYLGAFAVTNLLLGTVVSERERAEEDLRESEERFRTMADSAPALIWMAGTDKKCTYFNKQWLEFTGRTLQQELGDGWAEGVHPDDATRCLETYVTSFDARREFQMEFRLRRRDGTYRWILDRGIPRFAAADEFAGYLGSCIDITERKEAEESMRESENRFRTLASHAPVGIFMSNPSGDSIYVNECWCAMAGLRPEQAQGRDWLKAVHPDDRERIISGWNEAVSRNDSSTAEFRFLHSDGTVTWVYGNAMQLRNATGQLVGYIGTVVDITVRKQSETVLRQAKDELAKANEWLEKRVQERTVDLIQSNAALQAEIVARKQVELVHAQLAAIVEFSADAILSKTTEGFITSWNKGAEKMFGYAADEIVGRSILVLLPPDRSDELGPFLESILRDEAVAPFETVRVRKDGRVVHVWLTLSPIRDEAGHVTGVSAIMKDISELKRLEAEVLQVSEREQRRIAEDLHDGVGQQLGGISCLSEVLKKNLAEQASPEAEAAAKISKLLDVAMAQTRSLARGLHPVPPESYGLMSALEDMANRVTDLFKVSCEFECPEPVLVEDNGTATHIYRIAQEAVTNALKHGKAQHIRIGLFSTPERITLAVNDDGAGFNRSERPSKGLGLRIMNHRAGMIGGNFFVQRRSDGGTVATCTVQINNALAPKTEDGRT